MNERAEALADHVELLVDRLRAAEQERDELRKLLRKAWNEVGDIALAVPEENKEDA